MEDPILSPDEVASCETETRRKYSGETAIGYSADSVSRQPAKDSGDYFDCLLRIRMDFAGEFARGKRVLDVGCANGAHLLALAGMVRHGIGVDFSRPLIRRAREERNRAGAERVDFVVGNARSMPFRDGCFDFAYSFSSLYYMPNVEEVIREIARVLAPGGSCLVEMGNSRSLNALVADAYPELARSFHLEVSQMKKILRDAGFDIFFHEACQILPYWGDRPRRIEFWLRPFWKRWFQRRLGRKMIDERVSNFPLVRNFAFRHLFLCNKGLRINES